MAPLSPNARLALDAIRHRRTPGIPTCWFHTMEHSVIERIAGASPGDYVRSPEDVYLRMEKAAGVCVIDQYIPRNPLTMGQKGYEQGAHSATTGLKEIGIDGMKIDSPEALVAHMEKIHFPRVQAAIKDFNETARVNAILENEQKVQNEFGPDILKAPYSVVQFPKLLYSRYGYENYFMAFALYPEVIEKCFSLDADLALLNNRAVARAFDSGEIPAYDRLDNDMADSRGTLVDIQQLDRMWLPHFTRCLKPVAGKGYTLLWHCDGNLMQMVPRLLEAGLNGFQGFQYEDGMDYIAICKMKPRDGRPMFITAGVSVTTTLPLGKPEDVKKQLKWLVDNGPETGLMLAPSSSMAPGVPWENTKAFMEGLKYYREHGRN
jgi:uroporphyrinogen decarboxylase